MNNKPLVIAIDGPAASGKGSLARRLAKHFGAEHLDTGKLYRLVGLKLIESGENVEAAREENSKPSKRAIEIAKKLHLSEIDSQDLGTEEIGKAASIVSAIPEVRAALLEFQRKVAASKNGAVLDGRDIGTVVCPDADLKFFITANIETRAERRYKELQKQGNDVIYTSVLEDLKGRDERDSARKISPLRPAIDAICVDTTNLNVDEVFVKVLKKIESSKYFKKEN